MQFKSLILFLGLGLCLAQEHPWTPQAKDQNWMDHHVALLNQTELHRKDERVVFIGDSITVGWANYGKTVFTKYYTPRHAYLYGIGGDRTENVLWRIANKEFDGINAKVSILMIGTNNLHYNVNEDIAHGIKEIIDQLFLKMPSTKIILLGVLPRGSTTMSPRAKQLNTLIAKFGDNSKVFWLDMWSQFESPDGKIKAELYTPDPDILHPNTAGYEVWQRTMEPLLNKLDPIS